MSQCHAVGDFKKYFDENMEALGAPVPSGLFETYDKAIGTAAQMVAALEVLRKGATVAELFAAMTLSRALLVAGALSAAAYTGVVIGSIFVASIRSLSCASGITDFPLFIQQHNLAFRGWWSFYARNPEVLDRESPFHGSFGVRARTSPQIFG